MQLDAAQRRSKKAKYDEVVEMEDEIVTYCEVYAEDLKRRLGITADELPAAYSIPTLMNLMFGRKPNIIRSRLMTEKQYANGRDNLLSMMQDVYNDLTPVYDIADSDGGENNSKDG